MSGKKVKELRRIFRATMGHFPLKALFNLNGNVVRNDEFRQFKKQYYANK